MYCCPRLCRRDCAARRKLDAFRLAAATRRGRDSPWAVQRDRVIGDLDVCLPKPAADCSTAVLTVWPLELAKLGSPTTFGTVFNLFYRGDDDGDTVTSASSVRITGALEHWHQR